MGSMELEGNENVKKIMHVLRHAPHGTIYTYEGLEMILIMAAYEQDLSVVFIGDGVYALKKGQDTTAIGSILEKSGRSTILNTINKLLLFKSKNLHGHLAGNESNTKLLTHAPELLNCGNTFLFEGLLHQHGRHVIKTGNITGNDVRHWPVKRLKLLAAEGHFHGHGRITVRRDLGVDLFFQQRQPIKGKENNRFHIHGRSS